MQDHKASEGQKEAKGEKSKEAQREGGEGGEGGGTFAGLVGTFRPCTWETQEFRSPREIYALPKRRRASDQSDGRIMLGDWQVTEVTGVTSYMEEIC